MFDNGLIFIIQLIGVVSAGGFIGEFYRTVHSNIDITPSIFIANYMAGCFLSFMFAYMIYTILDNENLSLIIGGLLSYQEQEFIARVSKKLLNRYVKEVVDK